MATIGLYLMAALYFFTGVMHFRYPKVFGKIIPPILGNKILINTLSGAAEIILAVALLIPGITQYAAWGVIALLIAVFPANIYHLRQKGAGMKIPIWLLWLRLPLQGVLIYWAYLYT